MINIQDGLDRLFKFERDISPAYAGLVAANAVRMDTFTNVRLQNDYLGIYGVAEHHHVDRDGGVILAYAVDRNIRKTGSPLPDSFRGMKDCEYFYYGMKLNCLAYLYGRKIKKLALIDCYNGCATIPFTHNKGITEDFFQWMTNGFAEPVEVPLAIRESKKQFALFA